MSFRILVIEDNVKNLKLVRDVLQYAGYDVVVARNWRGGLSKLQLATNQIWS
jgi:two-component system cell cycle response regulator DivK